MMIGATASENVPNILPTSLLHPFPLTLKGQQLHPHGGEDGNKPRTSAAVQELSVMMPAG